MVDLSKFYSLPSKYSWSVGKHHEFGWQARIWCRNKPPYTDENKPMKIWIGIGNNLEEAIKDCWERTNAKM